MALQLGPTARDVGQSRGLSQRAAAEELGVSYVHLSNVERGRAVLSTAFVTRFSTVFGVDLHVLAWCLFENDQSIPEDFRGPRNVLAEARKKPLYPPVDAELARGAE